MRTASVNCEFCVKKARSATKGDTSREWLKPFMTQRKYRKGDVLFRKGGPAHQMLLTVTGKFLVKEISIKVPPGTADRPTRFSNAR